MAAHNPILTRLFNAINDLLLDGRRFTTRVPELSGKAVHYHRLIAMAIKERRLDTARSLMYHHLNDLKADWRDFSKRRTSS
jgi:GntR family transcriptional regulator, transcriptional repressor for pyruvate dehydrogenase complex